MKVILYMAISVNGMIARKNDLTDWSEEESESYMAKVKECGNIIIGRRTYELMQEDENQDADIDALGNPQIVVLSTGSSLKNDDKVEFVNNPREAVDFLNEKGFKVAMVAGGGQVDTVFVKSGLVDEIFLDIEPVIFGEGIPLFNPFGLEINLELVGTKKIGKNGVQLHYKVLK